MDDWGILQSVVKFVFIKQGEIEVTSSNSTIVNSQGVKTATFYGWKYSHYFEVVEEADKNIRAHCKLCAPSQKTLASAPNTTSNFKKQLDTIHKLPS